MAKQKSASGLRVQRRLAVPKGWPPGRGWLFVRLREVYPETMCGITRYPPRAPEASPFGAISASPERVPTGACEPVSRFRKCRDRNEICRKFANTCLVREGKALVGRSLIGVHGRAGSRVLDDEAL